MLASITCPASRKPEQTCIIFSYLAPSPPFGSAALAFSLHLSPRGPMYYFGQRMEGSDDKAAIRLSPCYSPVLLEVAL